MSLTYTELQTQIARYLVRDDLNTDITSFITMGENEINRRLKVLPREEIDSFTLATSSDSEPMTSIDPAIDSVIRIWKTVNNDFQEIVYLEPLQFLKQRIISTSPGQPNYYTIQGGMTIVFDRTADQNYTIYVQFAKKFDIANDTTNWLSQNHEEAYLFGSLVQAEPFLKNDARIITWRTLFEAVMDQIRLSDAQTRGTQNMRLIPGVAGYVGAQRPFNITTG